MANHKSDCATHNMPAKPRGRCDCGAEEHPAIVALARIIQVADRFGWPPDSPGQQLLREQYVRENPAEFVIDEGILMPSRAAYAFMLGDLMEPSEAMKTAWENCVNGTRGERYRAMLRARAREVEVEI